METNTRCACGTPSAYLHDSECPMSKPEPAPAAYCAHCEEHARMRQPTPAVERKCDGKCATGECVCDMLTDEERDGERMTDKELERICFQAEGWTVAEVPGDDMEDLVAEARRARASENALQAEVAALKVEIHAKTRALMQRDELLQAAEADRDRLRAALEKTQTLLESAVGCLTAPRQEVGHALMDVLYVRKLVRAALSAPAENR